MNAARSPSASRAAIASSAAYAPASSRASAASPAAVASGFPESVPAWYTGPSGASSSSSAAGPPIAASGSPPPTTLPKIERSGVMPKRSCAPPGPTRKPVITSSHTRSAPALRAALAEIVEVAVGGRHQTHVRGDRLHEHRGDVVAVLGEHRVERVDVVVRERRSCRRPFPASRRPSREGRASRPRCPLRASSASEWPW